MALPVNLKLSVEKSLKEAPPKRPKGMKHIRRVLANIDKDIILFDEDQMRHKNCHADHVRDIMDSLNNFWWQYDQQPPWGIWDPKINKIVVKDGFHRTNAAKKCNWGEILVDVFESDSELATVEYQLISNQVICPKKGSEKGDVVNAILTSICDKNLADDESTIRDFIDITATHLSKHMREQVFIDVMNSCSSSKYRTYLTKGFGKNNLATACRHEFEIPYGGDTNFNDTGAFGYVTTEKTGRMTMMNAIKLIAEYYRDKQNGVYVGKIPPVLIYAYMEAPGHKKSLSEQRIDWKNSFDNTLELLKVFFEYHTGQLPEDFPIKFAGFLPQLIDKDPSKGGNPAETTIVDINGKPFNWKKLIK